MVVPNTNLRIGGGKDGLLYSLTAPDFGGLQEGDPQAVKINTTTNNVVWGAPVYHDDPVLGPTIYIWSAASNVRAYSVRGEHKIMCEGLLNGLIKSNALDGVLDPTVTSQSPLVAPPTQPGGILTVTSNNGTDGILWASSVIDNNRAGILYAFNTSDLGQALWSSNLTAARDGGYAASKFCAPTVGNGQVFLPTFDNQVRVYGLDSANVTVAAPTPTGAGYENHSMHSGVSMLVALVLVVLLQTVNLA